MSNSYDYDKASRIQTGLEVSSTILLFGATLYAGSRLGKVVGKFKHEIDVDNSAQEVKRLNASEAAGNKNEVVEYKMTFKRAGQEVDSTEYRPVSIKQLKTEQIQLQNQLNKDGADYYAGAGIAGVCVAFMGSTLIVTKLGDVISDIITQPLSEGLAHVHSGALNGFKNVSEWLTKKGGKKADNDSQKPTVN